MNSCLTGFLLIIVFMISFFTDHHSTPEIDIFSKIQPGCLSSFEFACDQLLESFTVFYQMNLQYHQFIRFTFFRSLVPFQQKTRIYTRFFINCYEKAALQ